MTESELPIDLPASKPAGKINPLAEIEREIADPELRELFRRLYEGSSPQFRDAVTFRTVAAACVPVKALLDARLEKLDGLEGRIDELKAALDTPRKDLTEFLGEVKAAEKRMTEVSSDLTTKVGRLQRSAATAALAGGLGGLAAAMAWQAAQRWLGL
ncbi:MAG: hypothetical protein PHO89_01145 [Methylacidiphilaceae bacterium]|nr:hypothetical protein [Candidatus Methylacidiphilaceae bacterium]